MNIHSVVAAAGGMLRPVTANSEPDVQIRCLDDYDPAIRTEAKQVQSGSAGKVTAKCKASEAVIDGGFGSTQGGSTDVRNMWVTSSRPHDSKDKRRTPDDGWTVKLRNTDAAKAKLTAYAFCE